MNEPFGNLSRDFEILVSLCARERAKRILEFRDSNPLQTFAMYRNSMINRLALFTARGWAKLILNRNRDLVGHRRGTADFQNPHDDFEGMEAFNFSHRRRASFFSHNLNS